MTVFKPFSQSQPKPLPIFEVKLSVVQSQADSSNKPLFLGGGVYRNCTLLVTVSKENGCTFRNLCLKTTRVFYLPFNCHVCHQVSTTVNASNDTASWQLETLQVECFVHFTFLLLFLYLNYTAHKMALVAVGNVTEIILYTANSEWLSVGKSHTLTNWPDVKWTWFCVILWCKNTLMMESDL